MTPPIQLDSLGAQGRVAALLGADAVAARSRDAILLPIHCAALASGPDVGNRLFRGGEAVPRDGIRELLVFTTGQIRLDFRVDGLRSSDGYDFIGEIDFDVAIIPEPSELASLRRVLLDRPGVLTSERVAERFRGGVRDVIRRLSGECDADDLIGGATEARCAAALADALSPELFAAGLTLRRVARVAFASRTYAAVRNEQQRASVLKRQAETDLQLRQATVAARELQVAGLEALLQRLAKLAQSQPGVTLRDLIRTFDPVERGELYAGLLATTQPTVRTQALLAVAGRQLLWFDPASPTHPVRQIELDDRLGALRSIRAHGTELLVGTACGVYRLDAAGCVKDSYRFEIEKPLRTGTNAATIVGGRLLATHSEVGLIEWPLDEPGSASFPLKDRLRGAATVRDVQVDADGQVLFAAADSVIAWTPGALEPVVQRRLPGRVESLLVADAMIAAGLDDGRVLAWPRAVADRAEARTIRPPTGDAVHSLGLVRTSGIDRLLVADGRAMLDLLVADDTYRVEYHAPEAVRWGWAAPDIVVGVNERRDRLFVWSTRQPASPAATIHVGRLCGHSIQDALLIPASQTA